MKNFSIKEILPLPNGVMLPFQELMERKRISRKIIDNIFPDKKGEFRFREGMETESTGGKIIMIEGRPFLIALATVVKPKDYVQTEIPLLADQLDKFALNLPGTLATKYKFIAGDVTEVVNDAAYVRFYATKHTDGPVYGHKWTSKGDEMLFGTLPTGSAWPVSVSVASPPTEVAPGIIARYREKVQRIKVQKSIYSVTDGQTLGFEIGHSSIDPSTAKPHLRIDLVEGGHPEIKYVKSIFDGLELQKNWSDGKGMVAMDKPKLPHLTDMGALPAPGQSALWGYQAIYLLNDKRTGTFCDVVWITVKGI